MDKFVVYSRTLVPAGYDPEAEQTFYRTVLEEIGTAIDMADAKKKFGGVPILGSMRF